MSDTQNRRRSDLNDSRGEDRKRSWRTDNDSRDGRDDRGFKQLKPGTMGMKVLVPNSLVGAIIGKGGEEMKKLKEESGCFIRLSPNDKYFPNTNERPCYIEGEPDSIIKAIEALQEKLANDNPRRGPSIDEQRKKQVRIIVGANAAGKCIGKGGENVKRLKSEFNVWIKVMGRDEAIPGLEERMITISGENESTIKAVKDILEMALTLNNGGTDKNLDYDSFTGGSTGGAPPSSGNNSYNQGGGYQSSGGGGGYQSGGGGGGYQSGGGGGGGGGGFNNSQGNFSTPQYNNQMGGNMGQPRSNSMGAPGSNSNMSSGGYNPMGGQGQNMGGPGQNMGGPGSNPMGGPNMGGAPVSYNQPPVQQYGNPQQSPTQFGQPGQFQGNIQQYPNNNTNSYNTGSSNPTIPIQQYPGGNTNPSSGGYGNNPGSGGYNSNPSGFNQGGYNQGAGNQGGNPAQGGYQSQGGFQGGNQGGGFQGGAPGPQGGFQGSNQGQSGFQGGNQGGFQSGPAPQSGFQGGNQGGFQGSTQGGFQGGNQGGRGGGMQGGMQGGRGGFQGGQSGRGNFSNNNTRGRGGPRGRSASRFSDRN